MPSRFSQNVARGVEPVLDVAEQFDLFLLASENTQFLAPGVSPLLQSPVVSHRPR
jgi:hypothetical protein